MPKDENLTRLTANEHLSTKKVIYKNFVGGVFWGLGSVLGATLFVTLLVWLLQFFNFIPVIGDFVSQITRYVDSSKIPAR